MNLKAIQTLNQEEIGAVRQTTHAIVLQYSQSFALV